LTQSKPTWWWRVTLPGVRLLVCTAIIYTNLAEVDISTGWLTWYQVSIDGSITWSTPTSVTDPENIGSPSITTDIAGRLHLLQPIKMIPQITEITYRIWDGDRLVVKDRFTLGYNDVYIPDSLATAISPSGNIILLYTGIETDATTGDVNYTLSYASQMVEIPVITPTP
jgi:hypothetical protein